jgi:3',5'-cyclic-nucleotide phosphodiesterase
MSRQLRISTSRAQAIEKAVGAWEFSAHDYTDEELVYGAHVMFEHALQMPEVSEYKITSGN